MLLLLLVAVVLPATSVVWFMTQAVRNERLAVRQKLEEVYRGQLIAAGDRLQGYWQDKTARLSQIDPSVPPPLVFAELVRAGVSDSVILYGPTGQLRYPQPAAPPASPRETESTDWRQASRLEHEDSDFRGAATAFEEIARRSKDVHTAARALLAQARCLAKAGDKSSTIRILARTLADERYRRAVDVQGRLIAPDAQLRALQLMERGKHPEFEQTVLHLRQCLEDYRETHLSSSQRRFLMRAMMGLLPDGEAFATLDAESLAGDYAASEAAPSTPSILAPSGLPNVWQLTSADGLAVALYRQGRLVSDIHASFAATASIPGARIKILPPGAERSGDAAVLSSEAPPPLRDWRLALHLDDPDPFGSAAARQITAYVWTGTLVIAAIAVLGVLIARYVTRQMQLTRLKNDLIATVSHELKTPLASMRVLADTLLDGKIDDEVQAREYVELIAQENARLSRLIDNFLTFSRMERNKRRFEFAAVRVGEVVQEALDAAGERFASPGCRVTVDVATHLPPVRADRDALVTVLLNLLDNAYKYSEDDKQITVRAHVPSDGRSVVRLEVQDNGIGLSRRAARKVFDRFYQVDQRLSRRAGGCGLGLSIVEFIVTAHGGSVGVTSQLGKGSTFQVDLPAAGTTAEPQR